MTQQQSTNGELKACPFCKDRGPEISFDQAYWRVACTAGSSCGVGGPRRGTERDAIEAWNARTPPANGEDMARERLEQAARAIHEARSTIPWEVTSSQDVAFRDARAALTALSTPVPLSEEAVERVARAMYADWPMRAISPALEAATGKPADALLSWDDVLAAGGNHDGLIRLARAALASLTSSAEHIGTGEVERLREAVQYAERVFREYAEMHRAKSSGGDPAEAASIANKVRRNQEHAEKMGASLQSGERASPSGEGAPAQALANHQGGSVG